MAFTLSNMLQAGISTMGRSACDSFTCSAAGTTLTAVNTKFNAVGKPVYDDDDKDLINGTLIVTTTTDGLAPQGEYSRISGYAQSTGTLTVDTAFTGALGSGDVCMIIYNRYPVEDLIELCNQSLRGLGWFYTIDTSLTTSATRDYTLPIAAKGNNPVDISIYLDSDQRVSISNFKYITAGPGTEATIQFDTDPAVGKTLYIIYKYNHPTLTAFDDVLDESIPQTVAQWALSVAIQRWQNPTEGIEIQFLQEAKSELSVAKQMWKRWKPKKTPRWAVYV